jgi:2-oxoglutarate dehydrogenase E1 component
MEADDFRRWGYLQADLDALGRLAAQPRPELDVHPDSPWRRIYCGTVGAEFMHLRSADRAEFVRERLETEPPPVDDGRILDLLLRAHVFEITLHSRYPGTKRFSIEGLEALLPFLDEVRESAGARGARELLLGTSHRGRLNTMTHIVGKRPRLIFAGFEDVDPRSVMGGGDVRYHLGATSEVTTRGGVRLRIGLVSNPSHLEAVDPVILGQAKARQDRLGRSGAVLPVLCHGDAAIAGQGVAAETLNLSSLPGYAVGGTIHVVLNNLVGFTTPPSSLQSTRFAADIARRLDVPVFHVNASDPRAAVRMARLAVEYRERFASDVVVDLIGFRRHGHSEVDDPTTTQPALYRRILETPPLWESFAARAGLRPDMKAVEEEYKSELDAARETGERPSLMDVPEEWTPYRGGRRDPADTPDTAVPRERLGDLGRRLTALPDGFRGHPKVLRGLDERRASCVGDRPVDWSTAEALAFASLLAEGVPVRLTGQDTRRGTFNQRHAALVDVETGREHVPLASLGAFACHDSPLSEAAAVGFEYGYSRESPETLTLWEAQFGDFANGAQTHIDQFLSAGEDKWGLLSGLALLLPHGYEGQGPEHSSARVERFLQLSAEHNWQVCQPSTAAQYFHLLRRQALRRWRKPLIVFTPKGMLRHPRAASPLEDFARGAFQPVLADAVDGAHRVLIATGKILHELRAEREKLKAAAVAVIGLEELYPFPEDELRDALLPHAGARTLIWVQEEPGNMGALSYAHPILERISNVRPVRAVYRSRSASPATGSSKAHAIEQAALLSLAFSIE